MMSEGGKWQARFERERKARKEAEQVLELKSLELYQANLQLAKEVEVRGSRLKAEEQKFAAIFEASKDGIILLDSRGKIVEANRAMEQMLACTRQHIVGTGFIRLIPREHWTRAHSAFQQVKETGYCRFGGSLKRSDGGDVPTEIVGIRTTIAEEVFFQGIVRDITQQNANLEALKAARDEAEEANRAKSLFLAAMSHEIRTPLNGIIGFADLVLNSELTSEQRQNLSLVQRSGDILLHIINDILDFSRIESGKLELEEEDYDLRHCIEDVLDLHANSASTKQVELLYEIEPSIPDRLRGDVTRVRQILMNLISNAIKFTAKGAITVQVSKREDNMVKISVKDSGIGFAADKAESLFESFHQEDVSTTRKYGGTGLGLAICRRLVEKMGGKIKAFSSVGDGAEFVFTLPLVEGSLVEDFSSVDAELFSKKKVLVIDDHEMNVVFLKKRLELWGFNISSAYSGFDGLKKMEKSQFDVLIVDMLMPEMNGIEFGKRCRKNNDTPMILATSARLTGEKELAREAGFAKVLFKPLRQNELLKTLKKILNNEDELPLPQVTQIEVQQCEKTLAQVLLAEDNAINAKLALLVLERLGCEVDLALNGLEVLEKLRSKRPYDIVLMDMRMPKMDGLEATRLIRQGQAGDIRKSIPIVAVTANAMKEDQKACHAAGMDDYLSKPLRPKEIEEKLKSFGLLT